MVQLQNIRTTRTAGTKVSSDPNTKKKKKSIPSCKCSVEAKLLLADC